MKAIVQSTLAALVLAVFAQTAAAEVRVGFVNSDRVMKEAPPAKKAQQKLEKEFEKRDQELQRVAKQLAQMAHNAVNTPDMRDFLQRLAQRWASVGRSLQAQDRDADPYPEPDVSSHHLNAHTPSPATPHVRWPATPETLQ